YFNTRHKLIEFKVSNIVLLSLKNLYLKVPIKKLAPKFVGLFKVINAIRKQDLRIKIKPKVGLYNIFYR
ncbi:hypothetical protein CERZMDRAFT_42833, partial [Cercospora zeae-maydis SCOH1-5]